MLQHASESLKQGPGCHSQRGMFNPLSLDLPQCPRAAAERAPQHVPVACRRGSPKLEQPRSLAGPANFRLLRQEYSYSLTMGMHGPHIALIGSSRQGYATIYT